MGPLQEAIGRAKFRESRTIGFSWSLRGAGRFKGLGAEPSSRDKDQLGACVGRVGS